MSRGSGSSKPLGRQELATPAPVSMLEAQELLGSRRTDVADDLDGDLVGRLTQLWEEPLESFGSGFCVWRLSSDVVDGSYGRSAIALESVL